MNSIVFEFQARGQLVSNHVSAGVIKQLRIPVQMDDERLQELVCNNMKTNKLEWEIEIRVAQLYGISREQFLNIISRFEFSREELETVTDEAYDDVIVSIIEKVKEYSEKFSKKIPVVVAGGIYERKDMEHVMKLGADGVQMGTRFVTTKECDADEAYKQSYIKAKKEDIKIVQSPVGMPGRAILNPFLEKVKTEKCKIKHCYQCIVTCDKKTIPYCITEALVNAAEGRVDEGLLFCGENAYRADKIETVAEIMEEFR